MNNTFQHIVNTWFHGKPELLYSLIRITIMSIMVFINPYAAIGALLITEAALATLYVHNATDNSTPVSNKEINKVAPVEQLIKTKTTGPKKPRPNGYYKKTKPSNKHRHIS